MPIILGDALGGISHLGVIVLGSTELKSFHMTYTFFFTKQLVYGYQTQQVAKKASNTRYRNDEKGGISPGQVNRRTFVCVFIVTR